ncbi:hypothetical protein ABT072_00745 [Streptomyces sp. NPDC002589]|uniref:hypothetical protein n=1 Tax=Streptomyces sp. NPDC002589 TaxID=3154420 RepID=UPI00332004AF
MEGVLNFRGIGGLVTADGSRIRTSVVSMLGISKVIDFRTDREQASGQDRLSAGRGPLVRYPIVANSKAESLEFILKLTPQEQMELLGDGKAKEMMIKTFVPVSRSAPSSQDCVTSPSSRPGRPPYSRS